MALLTLNSALSFKNVFQHSNFCLVFVNLSTGRNRSCLDEVEWVCRLQSQWPHNSEFPVCLDLNWEEPLLLRSFDKVDFRGGLASRATGLGPEGPPSAKVPMGPFCAGRKIFQMVNFG